MIAGEARAEPREIPLHLINPPALPARSSMDDLKLEELTRSIARLGVISRLIVCPIGDRYEVIAGHRRLIAATRAGLVAVPCEVYPSRALAHEAIKFAENRFREDMSAAEEALYFGELLERECGGDIEMLAGLVGERVSYVDNRLQLLAGDPEVLRALGDRKIGITVAHELNKCPDQSYRRHFLEHAVKGGATQSAVAGWIQTWKLSIADHAGLEAPASVRAPAIAAAPVFDPMRCAVCGESNSHIPETISIHTHCRLAILEPLLKSYRGEGHA